MKKVTKLEVFFAIVLFLLLFSHCRYDSVMNEEEKACENEYTFNVEIKPILALKCAYAPCHVAGGQGIGELGIYSEVARFIENGAFERSVFEFKSMPPSRVVEDKKLLEEELKMLKCWIDNGYPES